MFTHKYSKCSFSFVLVIVIFGLMTWGFACKKTETKETETKKTMDFKSLPDGAFRAEISVENPPLSVPRNSLTKVKVKVRNLSNSLWPSIGLPDGKFKIHLGDHWLDKNGKMLVRDSSRSGLPHGIKPGEEVIIGINLKAPPTPGDYILEYDMVQEYVTWFAAKGSKTARVKIKVI